MTDPKTQTTYPRDAIYLREFLPHTRSGLLWIGNQLDRDIEDMTLPEDWSWFWFRLKFFPDSDEAFPAGKWATIQRIEDLICECARYSLQMEKAA